MRDGNETLVKSFPWFLYGNEMGSIEPNAHPSDEPFEVVGGKTRIPDAVFLRVYVPPCCGAEIALPKVRSVKDDLVEFAAGPVYIAGIRSAEIAG
jgi:hypothetical protein